MGHCEEYPPPGLLRAIDEFNRGDWFECHETIEELWTDEVGEVRDLYQGILQVAVALYHWRKGNFCGAVSLLSGGAAYLRQVRPVCQDVDAAGLAAAADRLRDALANLGPARMAELDPVLIPVLRLNLLTDAEK